MVDCTDAVEALTSGGARVLYLYGVVPCGQSLPTNEAVPVATVAYASLVALVEPVSASEFSAAALEQKLASIDWVAPLARKHSAVLEQAMQHGPVVPAQLCTLFSSAHALTSLLARNEQRLHDKLGWLEGREEHSCKIFCHEDRLRATIGASDPEVQALAAAAATSSPGQAYVLGKKRDGRLSEVVASRIDEVVDEVLDALASLAVETRLRPLLSEATTARREPMALNAALLVDVTAREAFRATTAELAARFGAEGFTVEATGPWPPYSFSEDDDDAGDLDSAEPWSEEAS